MRALKKLNPFRKPAPPARETTHEVLDYHLEKAVRILGVSHLTRTMMIVGFVVLSIVLGWAQTAGDKNQGDYISQVRLEGGMTDQNGGSGYQLVKHIKRALDDHRSKGVLIIANSGGGSPTQAEIVYQYLREYTSQPLEERQPIYVSIQSSCASACYYALSPADRIFAHNNSIVGSIGVRMDSWDFSELAERLGVRRNTLTSGEHKNLIDQFKPMSEEAKEKLTDGLINPMHEKFVHDVLAARPHLADTSDNLFSGFIWLGDQAADNGLVDKVATIVEVENIMISETGALHHRLTHRSSRGFMQFLTSSLESILMRLEQY